MVRRLQGRGVSNPDHRARLIEIGTVGPQEAYKGDPTQPLPGASTYWQLEADETLPNQIRAVSTRLLQLHSLLGNREDVKVADMLIKEPRLLSTELETVATRLIAMKTTQGAETLDIGKVVEDQPYLLLQNGTGLDSPDAWTFGLVSNSDEQWLEHLKQLQQYKAMHGDVHVGFRDSDHPMLCRFAKMQRAAHKQATLKESRKAALEKLDFLFDAGDAEWNFMFRRLQNCQAVNAEGAPPAIGSSDDFLLTNWCSVQRIANRSGVLSQQRRELLDSIGFDWTAADALS